MGDPKVEKWRKVGRVFVWHAAKDTTCNISADDEGCESLLDLFSRMKDAQWSSRITFKVNPSAQTANVVDEKEIRNCRTITLLFSKEDKELWTISLVDNCLEIRFGALMLDELIRSIEDVRLGKGDNCIGTPSLWFWWKVPNQ